MCQFHSIQHYVYSLRTYYVQGNMLGITDTNRKMTHACFLKDYLEHDIPKNFWHDGRCHVQFLLFQKDF